ncbi:hypothetical protein A1O1_08146 [Capronia coronata CBS 617.96]|uniref:Uncharacterized protein n=1 Tax=Capronia coronata CBS 617.96 TaxID=1182541 RepID=W9XNE7_9EURO|nr:uncharacterized protein A1O1_08146 [Capronia coronata CBS 617.96]EXJ82077.1 hypothetical protein A1O1_08146 [Capronia coronata CBS 617.96]
MSLGALPLREKGATSTVTDIQTPPESPKAYGELEYNTGAVHPQLRRLSSCHGHSSHYCTKCHMRRPSQEHLATARSNSHSPDDESWDGFCPDIHMPEHAAARPAHHTRRHSGLCPQDLITAKTHQDGRTSPPTQMTIKSRPCHHTASGYHHDCHCERVTPVENLSERFGLVEEPEEIVQLRRSLEMEAADQMTEIMHEELVADLQARQMRM